MSCPKCKSREELVIQVEARYPIKFDPERNVYIQEPGEEELLCVECENCGETFPDEGLNILQNERPLEVVVVVRGGAVQAAYSESARIKIKLVDFDELETTKEDLEEAIRGKVKVC